MTTDETEDVPRVDVVDLQAVARQWAHARREARRWAEEADRLGEELLPAMDASGLHGVTGEDWVVRIARRPRYYGATPERIREVLGPAEAEPYIHTVVDWSELVRAYGEGIVAKLGALRAETAYLALGRRGEKEGDKA